MYWGLFGGIAVSNTSTLTMTGTTIKVTLLLQMRVGEQCPTYKYPSCTRTLRLSATPGIPPPIYARRGRHESWS